jgi:tRNA A-37 threonylcarbamoyl transferase component Bud32
MSKRDDSVPSPLATAPGPAPALVTGGDLAPGYVVGEYRVERVLGRGGMGVVYAGTQPLIEKQVAIKVLNLELSSDPNLVKRFLDEARAVNRIRHPNIIDIFSFGQIADSRQYFVMEYLEGRTLADRLQAGDLAVADLPPLLGQICDALDAAHGEHIVHRDLKPENVWIVEPKRGRPFVKLLDFGIAKLLATGDQATTQAGVLMGTPQYMSPEQCHGRAIDHRTDIYAMGVMLYQIYTGRLPFAGDTFAEILTKQLVDIPEPPSTHATLPPALDDLILRCLAKDPALRPQSARALGEELAAILVPSRTATTSPGHAATTTTLHGSARVAEGGVEAPPTSRRWLMVGALLAVGALSALAATRLAGGRRDRPRAAAEAPPLTAAPPAAPVRPPVISPPDAAAVPAPLASTPPSPAALTPRAPAAKGRARESAPRPGRRSPATRAAGSGLVTDNPFR